MATRSERARIKYNKIIKATGNVDLARKYRYYSNIRIKNELGIDITEKTVKSQVLTASDWKRASTKKDSFDFPPHIVAYAIQKNREVGADDYDRYGFIFTYKRLIEGKGVKTIQREVVYDRFTQTFLYRNIR